MGGQIMPWCTSMSVYHSDNFTNCTCTTLCAYCGSKETEGRCRWPVEMFIAVPARDLVHGDTVAHPHPHPGKIVDILPVECAPALLEFKVRIARIRSPKTEHHTYTYRWDFRALIKKLTTVECGEPVCYRHLREVDDGAYICAAHWSAQLEVA